MGVFIITPIKGRYKDWAGVPRLTFPKVDPRSFRLVNGENIFKVICNPLDKILFGAKVAINGLKILNAVAVGRFVKNGFSLFIRRPSILVFFFLHWNVIHFVEIISHFLYLSYTDPIVILYLTYIQPILKLLSVPCSPPGTFPHPHARELWWKWFSNWYTASMIWIRVDLVSCSMIPSWASELLWKRAGFYTRISISPFTGLFGPLHSWKAYQHSGN